MTLTDALAKLLNEWSAENESNTPDYILAQYLQACLIAFNCATQERERWLDQENAPDAGEKEGEQ